MTTKQRSLLLARSTLEYSNKLLHEYSREEVDGYKELNVDLDRYTRAFDVIDVMYQSLRTVLNVKDTYRTVSDRIGDYKTMLETFHEKVLKRGKAEASDLLIITVNEKAIRNIAREGEHLYKSVSDLVLYATGAAACSTNDLLMVLENVNRSHGQYRTASEPGLHGDMALHTGPHRLLESEDLPGTYQTRNCRRGFRAVARCRTTGLLTNDKREKK